MRDAKGQLVQLLILAALTLFPATSAGAKATYATVWIVEPDQAVRSEAQWVDPSGTIASAKLIPAKLFSAPQDIVAGGSVILERGSKLVWVSSKDPMACGLIPVRKTGIDVINKFAFNLFVCVIDTDGDGKFDRYFKISKRKQNDWKFPIGSGKVPSRLSEIEPQALTQEDPRSLVDVARVYIKYGWFASLADNLVFQICLNENDGGYGRCLLPDASVKKSKLPGEFQLLGSIFNVDAKEGNRVRVSQLSQFQRMPLFVD